MAISAPEHLTAAHDLSRFDCGKPALNDWLRNFALSNQAKGFTRVIVVHDEGRVAGFYGVAPTAVAPALLSRSLRTGRPPDPIPAILLGQFAVDLKCASMGLGSGLLRDALGRCVAAAEAISGRAIIVHAIDAGAEKWWRSNGFAPSRDDPATLFAGIKAIAEWLRET